MFKITSEKGFHLTFENRVTISVQWGFGNYCENRWKENVDTKKEFLTSKNAEVAIWDEDDMWLTKECFLDLYGEQLDNDVKGYVTADEVADIIQWCKNKEVS